MPVLESLRSSAHTSTFGAAGISWQRSAIRPYCYGLLMARIIWDAPIIKSGLPKEVEKMKLNDVWNDVWEDLENLYFWLKRKKPDVITFLMQLAIWVVGGIIISFFMAKEFYERRMGK